MSPATGDEPKDVTDPAPVCSRHDRYPAQRGLGLLASGEAAVEVSGTGLDEELPVRLLPNGVAVAERNGAAAMGHPSALWTGCSTPWRRSAKHSVPETP